MKYLILFLLLCATTLCGFSQLASQIQAKRGVFTEKLYLRDRWIYGFSTDLNSSDSTSHNLLPTAKSVVDLIRQSTANKDIDVFLIAGQSNAKGKGDSTLSPKVISGKVLQINTGVITDANDPVGQDVPGSNERSQYGSAWPSFGNTYYNRTSRMICMVPSYKGGTSQCAAADAGAGNWDTTGVLFDSAVARVISSMSVLAAKGYNPIFKGVMWLQGESDAIGIQNGLITQTDYINAFTKMLKKFRQNFGASMPFYIIRIGTSTTYNDTYWQQIRDAQQSVGNGDSVTQIVYYNSANFINRNLMQPDGIHYNQIALNEVGQMSANAVLTHNKNIWQPQDASIFYPNSGTVAIGGPPTETFNLEINTSKNSSSAGIKILNSNSGSGAFSAIRLYNNVGPSGYIYTSSSTASSYRPNAFTLFAGFSGGLVLSASQGDIIFSPLAQGTSSYARYVRATGNYLYNTETDNGANGRFQVNSTSWFNGVMKLSGVTAPPASYNILVHGVTDSAIYQIPVSLSSAILDFPSTLANTSSELTITVPGAAIGDPVSLGIPGTPDGSSCYTAYVSEANIVTVRFNNYSADTIDPLSGLFKIALTKF